MPLNKNNLVSTWTNQHKVKNNKWKEGNWFLLHLRVEDLTNVKYKTDRATKFWTQGATDHVIGTTAFNRSVGRNG